MTILFDTLALEYKCNRTKILSNTFYQLCQTIFGKKEISPTQENKTIIIESSQMK